MTLADQPPATVYAFEPPRVSVDTEIAKLPASVPMKLYKNGNDLVPDVPPEMNHAGPLGHIGNAARQIPNIEDHKISRVIASLSGCTK